MWRRQTSHCSVIRKKNNGGGEVEANFKGNNEPSINLYCSISMNPKKIMSMHITENKKQEEEQKVNLLKEEKRYPVEQVANTGKPTKKQVKAAVKELNPDTDSLGSRG